MGIPTLQFDFHLNDGEQNRAIVFTNPVDIVSTYKTSEVHACLKKIEKAIDNGFYVAGYLSYEATYAFYNVNKTIDSEIPLLWFGLFERPIYKPLKNIVSDFSVGEWTMIENKHSYFKQVNDILKLIHDKQTEQVNYTIPFETIFKGDSFSYYEQLKRSQRADFSAFFQFEQFDILSVSPELFFSIEDKHVMVKPMKGTIHRGKTYEEDLRNFNWLQHSEKNMIENDLITNLMKNELHSIANNVAITERYTIKKYPTVFQMTSTIKGEMKKQIHPIDVLKRLFPSGSITGLPKKKTIEIIADMETTNRGVYCGAIGYFKPNFEAVFNVPIRTVTIDKHRGKAKYFAGGAITEHSKPDEEFKEVIAKTKVLKKKYPEFQLLETILLHDGNIFLKDEHIERLLKSAAYFDININRKKLDKKLNEIIKQYTNGKWRVRLLVDENGMTNIEIYPLENTFNNRVRLSKFPIDKSNAFLYHKTTERSIFEKHINLLKTNDLDILLWNEQREITEFSIGNVVVERNGELITPPVNCGLLPGTFRGHLLENGIIKEDKIYIDELEDITNIWLINSVRKWVKVNLN